MGSACTFLAHFVKVSIDEVFLVFRKKSVVVEQSMHDELRSLFEQFLGERFILDDHFSQTSPTFIFLA